MNFGALLILLQANVFAIASNCETKAMYFLILDFLKKSHISSENADSGKEMIILERLVIPCYMYVYSALDRKLFFLSLDN